MGACRAGMLASWVVRNVKTPSFSCRLWTGATLNGQKELAKTMGMTESDVKAIWRSADAVCFDVDSTVCVDEAIDELAAYRGVGKEVAELTNQAMGGSMTFQESLGKRLSIIRPSIQNIKDFMKDNPPRLTEGMSELVGLLHSRKVAVYLVSGGFQSIIENVASKLNIPKENIYANRLFFDHNGEYACFDHDQPTCQSGGKPKVIQMLKDSHGYQRLVHIGDGATDMEACPPADAFIGFGGHQVREKVKQGSKWFVTSITELIDELNKSDIPQQ